MRYSKGIQQLLWRFQSGLVSLLRRRDHKPKGIGLALSGGVDSVALAWLYHASLTAGKADDFGNIFGKLPFKAIIVNHRLRPESGQECIDTCERFRRLTGQAPIVIDIDWARHGGQPRPGRLETVARRFRYRSLGEVCRSHGLDLLMTGHHADDNAETVFMRLISHPGRFGLQGIAEMAPIPECEDIYAASQEVSGDAHEARPVRVLSEAKPAVQLVRPLLTFDKQELVILCQQMGIAWAEDKTNADRTLTIRNSVRHLFKADVFPEALQKKSLLRLADANRAAARAQDGQVRELTRAAKVFKNPRSGIVSFVLPDAIRQNSLSSSDTATQTFVRDLVQAASPRTAISIAECDLFTRRLLCDDYDFTNSLDLNMGLSRKQLSGQRAARSLPVSACNVSAVAILEPDGCKENSTKKSLRWHLIRYLTNEGTQVRVPLIHTNTGYTTPDYPYMASWDNRFWVKVILTQNPAGLSPEGSRLLPKPLAPLSTDGSPMTGSSRFEDDTYLLRQLSRNDISELRKIATSDVSLAARQNAAEALQTYEALPRLGDNPPVIPVVSQITKTATTTFSETMIAIPSFEFVRPGYEHRIRIDLAYKYTGLHC